MPSPRRASKSPSQPAPLVGQFAAFYRQLQGLADRLRRGSADADDARSQLVRFFEDQENASRSFGAGYLQDIAAPARRAMATLADQWLGHDLDWAGKTAWAAAPLATRLFAPSTEAEVVAKVRHDLDHLLAVSSPSAAQRSLARVYLEAISFGLSRPFAHSDVADLKKRLFTFLYPHAPADGQDALLFPEAYAHTATGGERTLLPTPAPWWRVLAVAGVLLLLISWPVWRDATELLRTALDSVPQAVPTAAVEPRGVDRP
ncbi:MAG: DotU family type IV/VI secretion system protein [Acidobacteriota bacterium]